MLKLIKDFTQISFIQNVQCLNLLAAAHFYKMFFILMHCVFRNVLTKEWRVEGIFQVLLNKLVSHIMEMELCKVAPLTSLLRRMCLLCVHCQAVTHRSS